MRQEAVHQTLAPQQTNKKSQPTSHAYLIVPSPSFQSKTSTFLLGASATLGLDARLCGQGSLESTWMKTKKKKINLHSTLLWITWTTTYNCAAGEGSGALDSEEVVSVRVAGGICVCVFMARGGSGWWVWTGL
jgi:hypothetical protein